jgi:hypothetical protein
MVDDVAEMHARPRERALHVEQAMRRVRTSGRAHGEYMDALKTFEAKEQKLQADIGVDKYASYRVIGIEGIEQK